MALWEMGPKCRGDTRLLHCHADQFGAFAVGRLLIGAAAALKLLIDFHLRGFNP
jgi:hypothetical protein